MKPGPRTTEGREAIADAQRRRWTEFRIESTRTLPKAHSDYANAMSRFWREADDDAPTDVLLRYAQAALDAAPSGSERSRWKRIVDALRAGRRVARKIRTT